MSTARNSNALWTAFAIALIIQAALAFYMQRHKPNLHIVSPVPTERQVKLFALGDTQPYFRALAFRLQNAGDTYGRNTPLKDYDYEKLYRWFTLLDSLDAQSHFVPALAGYYFSQSQDTFEDVPIIIRYLEEHYDRNPKDKWWWLAQAVHLANFRIKDKELALRLAYKLSQTPAENVPLWVRQYPAFIHEDLGEEQEAYALISDLLENQEDYTEGELNFMHYFLNERLNVLKEANESP